MDSSKLRFSAADPRADVVDPTDSRAKAVFNRCDAFFKLRQSFIDKHNWSETRVIPCTVDGVKTVCEGAYGIPLADGKFMPLSRIDAIRYHHENRPWAPYFREPQSIYDSRIAQAEQVRAEAERQREAKRIAEEKAAADRAKQAEEERQREAKRIAEEERQREAKRIADARAVIEKTENQKSQEKKNFAKDVFARERDAAASNSKKDVQKTQNYEDIGACFASIIVKVTRKIPITESMRDFGNKYNPTSKRLADVIKNKCNGLSDTATVSCMQKNGVSPSDTNFYVGASRTLVFINSPQDPSSLPNIEVASIRCLGLTE
jgi:hypothetical protein